jgi:hypothetical protein
VKQDLDNPNADPSGRLNPPSGRTNPRDDSEEVPPPPTLTPRLARAALVFLDRTTMGPGEIRTYLELERALRLIAMAAGGQGAADEPWSGSR